MASRKRGCEDEIGIFAGERWSVVTPNARVGNVEQGLCGVRGLVMAEELVGNTSVNPSSKVFSMRSNQTIPQDSEHLRHAVRPRVTWRSVR